MRRHEYIEITSLLNVLQQRPEGRSYDILLKTLVARIMIGCWADFLGLSKHFDEAEVSQRFTRMRELVERGTEGDPAERQRLFESLENAREGIDHLGYGTSVLEVGNKVAVVVYEEGTSDEPGRVLS